MFSDQVQILISFKFFFTMLYLLDTLDNCPWDELSFRRNFSETKWHVDEIVIRRMVVRQIVFRQKGI